MQRLWVYTHNWPDSFCYLCQKFFYGQHILYLYLTTMGPCFLVNSHTVLPLVFKDFTCNIRFRYVDQTIFVYKWVPDMLKFTSTSAAGDCSKSCQVLGEGLHRLSLLPNPFEFINKIFKLTESCQCILTILLLCLIYWTLPVKCLVWSL